MKILALFLFVICFSFADNNATINQNKSNIVDNNATSINDATNNVLSSNQDLSSNQKEQNKTPDEQLKNEIITYDRVNYIKENSKIDDPFIYVFPQSEEDLANILKTEQAVLVLNGIFEDKASINNKWVGKNDVVEGWTVSDIQRDRVELKFRTQKRVLYVYTNDNKIKIK